jgi:multicomponent Na+:H+ antiporter subunit E
MNTSIVRTNIFITLLAVWLMLNASLDWEVVLVGVLVSAFLSYFLEPLSSKYADIKFSPEVIVCYFKFLGVFMLELIKSNIQVARLVISPNINISPAIIKIKTSLKTPVGRLALCNSITLTPGTLVIEIKEDTLFVHCIDVKEYAPEVDVLMTAAKFEKYLKVVYG